MNTTTNPFVFSTDREIQAYKGKEKRYTAKDKLNNGLFIDIKPTGRKTWMYRYTFNKKQEKLILGRYPDISLKDARLLRDEAATKIAKGISPKKEDNSLQTELIVFKHYGEKYIANVVSSTTQLNM